MKPLGRRAYGSIGHLPCSRLGPSDSCVTEGQSNICTVKTRDKHDKIIVQEKLDGSNVAIAKVGGVIYPSLGPGMWQTLLPTSSTTYSTLGHYS